HFEGNARATELLVGIIATLLIGIDDSQSVGNPVGAGEVMVGNDQVDAEAFRGLRGRERADAHIDADDQANSCDRGSFDDVVAHVGAFANAVGNVEVGGASAEFNRSFQNDDRHGAVDVIVAVNENRFFAFD